MSQTWIGRGALVLSLGVHGWLFSIVPQAEAHKDETPEPTLVEFTAVVPEPKPEPEPIPEPIPELAPEPEPEPEVVPLFPPEPVPEVEADPISEVPPEAEPAPALPELTGTTLLAEGEGSFSAEVGSGRSRRGAIRAGVSTPQPARKVTEPVAVPVAKPAPPSTVPLAQLSKKPVPPSLGGALKKNYPEDARRQGKAGEAKVRARVEASGSIKLAKVASESEDGFGSACRKTLLGSTWTAPLDRNGKPVATWVNYSCKFRID